jgi:hypothetical protein
VSEGVREERESEDEGHFVWLFCRVVVLEESGENESRV